jgi:hypothetical protein
MAHKFESGSFVRHVLAGWYGFVLNGKEVNLTFCGEEVPCYDVRFWNQHKLEFSTLHVHEQEITLIADSKAQFSIESHQSTQESHR